MKKKIIITTLALILVATLTYINAKVLNPKQLTVREETIESNKIDESLNNLLIVYFSDLDYAKQNDIDEVINNINSFKPDIVLFGGDLLIKQLDVDKQTYLINKLNEINAKYGKFALFGEKDYKHQEQVQNILNSSNFHIINNEATSIYVDNDSFINIVGIDYQLENDLNLELFNNVDSNKYTIVLTHYPDTFAKLDNCDFDYCLAGHSYGGKVYFPLINHLYRDKGYQEYIHGKIAINNKTLDISSGLAFLNYRLNAEREIVTYKLISKNKDSQNK